MKEQTRNTEVQTNEEEIGKCVHQGCIWSPWLFNLYAEYLIRNAGLQEAQAGIEIAWRNINNLRYAENIMWRAGLYEAQAGIKIAWRNINNLRYADDTTLMHKVKKNLRAS